jgi:hypothetical protein
LENWTDAVEFEASMDSVRETYKGICESVLTRVGGSHKELDCQGLHLTYSGGYSLNLGLGKKAWSRDQDWPTGIWLENLWIENLTVEDEAIPSGAIWIQPPAHTSLDLADAVDRLRKVAGKILTEEELSRMECKSRKSTAYIDYPLRQSRAELVNLLRSDDAKGFVDCMVEHFEALSRFLPVLENIFEGGKRNRK